MSGRKGVGGGRKVVVQETVLNYLQKHGPSKFAQIPAVHETLARMANEGLITVKKEGNANIYSLPKPSSNGASTNGNGTKRKYEMRGANDFSTQMKQQQQIAAAAESLFGKNPTDWTAVVSWFYLTKEIMDRA